MTAQTLNYWFAEHPTIVNFRWSPTQSYASTWSFLFTAVSFYVIAAVTLHLLLKIFRRRRGFSLGPIPALHNLTLALISAVIFVGILLSAAAEIRDTRWLWRRTRTTALQWFLCFPVGTRASGRVFFWSYAFYLSRFLHLIRTFFSVIRRRKLSFFQLINQSSLLCISFLWLEYSQSCQVIKPISVLPHFKPESVTEFLNWTVFRVWFAGRSDTIDDRFVRRRLRLQILDGDWVTWRVFSVRS